MINFKKKLKRTTNRSTIPSCISFFFIRALVFCAASNQQKNKNFKQNCSAHKLGKSWNAETQIFLFFFLCPLLIIFQLGLDLLSKNFFFYV